MQTERRAEERHMIPYIWATVGPQSTRCEVTDIGHANALIKNAPDDISSGSRQRITLYITMKSGQILSVVLKGTVTRCGGGDVAVTYDPPTKAWRRVLRALSRPDMAPA